MFRIYLLNSMKKYYIKYAAIALSEIILLVVSLFALTVVLNYSSKNLGVNYASKFFEFSISKQDTMTYNSENLTEEEKELMAADFASLPYVSEMYDKVYEFCERCPVEIQCLFLKVRGTEKNYFWVEIVYFPTYEDLVRYFKEEQKPDYSLSEDQLPTREQYLNHEKTVILGKGVSHSIHGEIIYSDENHVLFGNNDDEYLIVGESSVSNPSYMLLGSEPDYLKFRGFELELKEVPTQKQIDETKALFQEIIAPDRKITVYYPPRIKDLLDIRKEAANVIVTAALMLISSFNIMVIFKHMIDERKSDYAVFRLCGYGKAKAMMFPFVEIISISGICAVLSCVVFALLTPLIKQSYTVVTALFDFGFYAVFALGFIAITAVLFLVYILPSLNKSVSDELREM